MRGVLIGSRLFTTVLIRGFLRIVLYLAFAFIMISLFVVFVRGVLIGLRLFTTFLIRCFLRVAW